MNIYDIVNYCNDLYTNSETNYRCESCNNECQGSCELCLDKIHFGDTRIYNCENIVNYYVCKYIYRYSSEIQYLFEIHHTLRNLDSMRIVSIGCGPCTDLFGILNTIDVNELDTVLEYTGIDLNTKWKNIHEFIRDNNDNEYNINFIYDDVFNVVATDEFRKNINPNIIIFQYVFSDMKKYKSDYEIREFINNLVDKVIKNLEENSFVIINDINYMDTRIYFNYMLERIESEDINIQNVKHHFKSNTRNHYDYGREYDCNDIKLGIPNNIINNYNSWEFCSSAQLIIRKGDDL